MENTVSENAPYFLWHSAPGLLKVLKINSLTPASFWLSVPGLSLFVLLPSCLLPHLSKSSSLAVWLQSEIVCLNLSFLDGPKVRQKTSFFFGWLWIIPMEKHMGIVNMINMAKFYSLQSVNCAGLQLYIISLRW